MTQRTQEAVYLLNHQLRIQLRKSQMEEMHGARYGCVWGQHGASMPGVPPSQTPEVLAQQLGSSPNPTVQDFYEGDIM